MTWWTEADDGLVLQIRAAPRAKRSTVDGVVDGRLRVRVHAPAVEGRANAELCRVVATWLGVRTSAVTITRGEHARAKTVHVRGVDRPPDLT